MKAAFLILAFVALSSTLYCEATEVSKSPKIVNQADLNHSEGTNATLMCSIGSGELEGLTYEWLKDDKKILPSSRYRVSIAPENFNSILRVIDLVPEDSGTYSCVARNSFGKDRISIKLQVKVQLKWIVEPKGALKVSVGKPLHIPCAADGQPAPRIVWTKLDNGAPSRTLGAELRFNALGQGDSGVYECRATNDAEEDLVATVEVNVLGKYTIKR